MNNKGFTLVELMGVLAILALITIIAVPSVMGFRNRANIKLYCTKVNSIKSAAILYAQDNDNILINTYNGYPSITIEINDLYTNGYLAYDNADKTPCNATNYVCDPRDNSPLDSEEIIIYKRNNRYYAEYSTVEDGEDICE